MASFFFVITLSTVISVESGLKVALKTCISKDPISWQKYLQCSFCSIQQSERVTCRESIPLPQGELAGVAVSWAYSAALTRVLSNTKKFPWFDAQRKKRNRWQHWKMRSICSSMLIFSDGWCFSSRRPKWPGEFCTWSRLVVWSFCLHVSEDPLEWLELCRRPSHDRKSPIYLLVGGQRSG